MTNLTSVTVTSGVPTGGTGTVSTLDALLAVMALEGGNLASILVKLSSDPATQTTLAAVLAKLSGDPATQTTLAAVLAKDEAIRLLLAGTLAVSGTFWQATQPVSIATAPALVAGSAIVGKVGIDQTTPGTTNAVQLTELTNGDAGKTNIKHINIVGDTLTRPANTTAYAALDSVSNNATAGSVTALTATVSDTNDDPVDLTEINMDSTDTGFAGVLIRVHLFTSDPTASTGVVGGDNAAWSNKKAGWAGSFSGTMVGFSDGSKGTLIPDGGPVRVINVESGGKRIWWQLQTLAAATPSANSTTFIPRFKGYQGRA